MVGVVLKTGETIDSALKRFKRECMTAGIQNAVKRREFHEKPSIKRKRKREAAQRRNSKRR